MGGGKNTNGSLWLSNIDIVFASFLCELFSSLRCFYFFALSYNTKIISDILVTSSVPFQNSSRFRARQ